MAQPQWFPPFTINYGNSTEQVISGILGFNNPTKKALEEAERLFGSEQLVSIVVSLGSGQNMTHNETRPSEEGLKQALLAMTLEGGHVADDLAQRFHNSTFYHRFSIDCQAGYVDVHKWDESTIGAITSKTRTYLERNSSRVASVVEILTQNMGSCSLGQLSTYSYSLF